MVDEMGQFSGQLNGVQKFDSQSGVETPYTVRSSPYLQKSRVEKVGGLA